MMITVTSVVMMMIMVTAVKTVLIRRNWTDRHHLRFTTLSLLLLSDKDRVFLLNLYTLRGVLKDRFLGRATPKEKDRRAIGQR